jgi:hypothetical protein
MSVGDRPAFNPEKGPVIYGGNLFLDSRLMGRPRGPWPSTFDQSREAEPSMHPVFADQCRKTIVSSAIEQAACMSDEEIFDTPIRYADDAS